MQAAPETLERITNFLGIRPFPQQVRFKRYNSRGRRRSRLCSHPNLVQNLKGLFEPEYNLLEEILGAAASERLRARRTRCECGSALTIIYANQRGTMWISAAAYEKAAFAGMCSRMLQRQSMHICTDSAPPWHTPKTWAWELGLDLLIT
eukprot:g8539.t1